MTPRKFVFSMTEAQAMAALEGLGGLVDAYGTYRFPKGSRVGLMNEAASALDEQLAQQVSPWERCKVCKGSGWIEDGE